MRTIAVVGAAGITGRHLIQALQGEDLVTRAVVHSAAGAAVASAAGASETAIGELADHGSLLAALEGVDAVYAIPPSLDPREDVYIENLVAALQKLGVPRIVYHSVLHPYSPGMRHHLRKARAEVAVRQSGLRWTVLQPAMFAQILLRMFGAADEGEVPMPFDVQSRFSPIDLADLATVAATILTAGEEHDYAQYELAGRPETMSELVATAGEVRGVRLVATTKTPGEVPLPPPFAQRPDSAADMLAMWVEYHWHGLLGNPSTFRMLLGRDPATFREIAERELGDAPSPALSGGWVDAAHQRP